TARHSVTDCNTSMESTGKRKVTNGGCGSSEFVCQKVKTPGNNPGVDFDGFDSGAAEVGTLARVHFDLLAFINEGRHLHDEACLSLGWLGHRGSSRRLEARF